jgi:hypothetical protein
MGKIWCRPGKQVILARQIRRILGKWQTAVKIYQDRTHELGYNDLGYDTTEKANFGFLLWGCAQLKMPFILEYTTKGKWKEGHSSQRRPDAWIWINKNSCDLIEVKMMWDNLHSDPPKEGIKAKIDLLRKELMSLKAEDRKAKLIGLCFIALWINKKFWEKEQEKNNKLLPTYLDKLQKFPFIDFLGEYRTPDEKKIFDNIDRGKWITPAVVVIGKYF